MSNAEGGAPATARSTGEICLAIKDTYKGESPAKKITRLSFWGRTVKELNRIEGRIVVLASREMGDYSVLSAMGLGPRVVSVDRVKAAADAASAKYPDADVRLGDVADVVEKLSEPVAAVFLDFCAPWCAEVAETSARVVSQLPTGAVFAIGLLKGREQDGAVSPKVSVPAPIIQNRFTRRAMASACKSIPGWKVFAGQGFESGARSSVKALAGRGRMTAGGSRTLLVALYVEDHCNTKLRPIASYEYQSRTTNSAGVPMLYSMYRVAQDLTNYNGFTSYTAKHQTDEDVRRLALRLSDAGQDAGALLNIPTSTIVAWKAHKARGTYDGQAAQ